MRVYFCKREKWSTMEHVGRFRWEITLMLKLVKYLENEGEKNAWTLKYSGSCENKQATI